MGIKMETEIEGAFRARGILRPPRLEPAESVRRGLQLGAEGIAKNAQVTADIAADG